VAKPISFARGAPSLDIIDVDGLRQAATDAFANDPGGSTAYGTSVGYPPLREWIAERWVSDRGAVGGHAARIGFERFVGRGAEAVHINDVE